MRSSPHYAVSHTRDASMAAVMKSVDTASGADTGSRYNIYTVIHKAYRGLMTDALLRWGRMDVADDGERVEAIACVRAMLGMCMDHVHHEDEFVHPAIERARAGGTARTAHEHVEHEAAVAKISADLAQFETAPVGRSTLAHQLYLQL